MELTIALVVIAATVIVVANASERFGLPSPLVLLVVGALGSVLPFVPEISLSPEVVLLGLLPPLLYAAALNSSLVDMRSNRGPILILAVGLVLFTALGVALVTWLLLPIPFAIAVALGAIVAPPDAVAATAIARRIGLPRRVTTILEGESLLNDATALVTLRTAVAAAGLAAHGGHVKHVSVGSVSLDFAIAVVGGVGIGVLAFLVIGFVRKHLHETAADTALSFIAPFAAYVPAEEVGASGVLAVVTAGLLLAHKAPILQSASSRLSERINWASITFLLENAVFLLIGLQLLQIIEDLEGDAISATRTVMVGLVILLVVLVLRPIWLIPFAWNGWRRSAGQGPWLPAALVASWAGMRGVVTLAAALTLPAETEHRPSLVMIALIVTVGTLLIQGTTLPMLARRLDIRGPDPREDALQEATIIQATTAAGLRAIEHQADANADALSRIREQATTRVNRIWERLGTLGGNESETPSEAYRRLRLAMLGAERAEVLKIRDEGQVDQAVLAQVMWQLDAEEAALGVIIARNDAVREAPLKAPDHIAGACEHLEAEEVCAIPQTPEGCAECLEADQDWVHLRLCTQCGHVGCCDSSPNQHATAHFRDTGHPVMRSLEPGEAWRWCFADEVLG